MKRFGKFLLTVMTVIMSASCVEEMVDSSIGEQELTFSASFDDAVTKTILTEGNSVHWLPGDCISVSGASTPFVSDATGQCAGTTFTGSAVPSDIYYAVYPYEVVTDWGDAFASVNVPMTQMAVKGTFADEVNISAASARASDMNMFFRNMLGYIKFTINENSGSIVSVQVSANGGESLTGEAKITFDKQTGLPSLISIPPGFPMNVSLLSDSVLAPGDYYIAMIPDTYSAGLTLTFTDAEGRVAEKAVVSELVLEPGKIQNIGTVSGLKFETAEDVLARERAALIAIYKALDGDNWTNNENWCSDKPVGEWYGVRTFNEQGFITHLFFDGPNNYKGNIPDDIGVLKHLEFIRLADEGIKEVSEAAFCSRKLREVDIVSEDMNVTLPSSINGHPSLESLSLVCNTIKFPESFGNLPFLEGLNIRANIGQVPEGIGTCKVLKTLSIVHSDIITLPESISNLTQLTHLDLSHNRLTGEFPKALLELTGLEWFSIADNALYGTIPYEVSKMMNNLKVSGNCPVKSFDLSKNKFVGEIPSVIYEHPDWTYLWYQFYEGNSFDFSKVQIPCPEILGGDIYGNPVNMDVLSKSKPFTILYQYPIYWGLSDLLFPNIYSIKKIYEKYAEKMNLIFWGEEYATVESTKALIDELGAEGWILCCARNEALAYDNSISINKSSCYPINTFPYLCVVDQNGYITFSSKDFNTYDQMYALFDELVGEVETDYYTSTDYSADGKVTTLHTATEGNGINIVLMGDAYSDRLIADGTYAADMQTMMDAFFSEEPYKSHIGYFNVYAVNVVSENEVYDTYSSTALGGWFGYGTEVGGNDARCFNYGLKAISAEQMDEALIIVAMNSDAYAGTCYMYYPSRGDYSGGASVAYFPVGSDPAQLAGLVHHEAGGHGFAKLGDEYAYEEFGEISQEMIAMQYEPLEPYGWWKNVDFTDDPSSVKWSRFLSDERYGNEGLGCFEGGLTYWSGVWRPTENSIMRYNTGGFNAPSREAIYYRIHKLAYGDSWKYDYEDFVEYDAVNRASSSAASRRQRTNYVERPLEPTSPPVVVRKSWKDAR
ncbi:MAG: hypothetical protein II194_08795 [Bacteroidales bacterium]|nr:hypothetical protein [Bacteroidales bacterium]